MKTKKAVKKLSLYKKTVAHLGQNSMFEAKGGEDPIPTPTYNIKLLTERYCTIKSTCEPSCSPTWCGAQCP
jgi:hypothetical protein